MYNQVFDEGLITSETDREAARCPCPRARARERVHVRRASAFNFFALISSVYFCRLAKELELKAKIEAEKAEKKAAGGVEEEYTGPKLVERKMNKSHIISFSPFPRK